MINPAVINSAVISHFVTPCCALSAKVCADLTERVMTNPDGRLLDVIARRVLLPVPFK